MSELYSIKDTTLTALGDAVRSKVIGTTELSINSIFNLKYQHNSDVMFEEFNLGGAKTKIKINSITNSSGFSYGEGNFVWSNIGIVLKGGYTKPPNNSEVAITISPGITFPYEVIADSGVITFLFMGGGSATNLNLDVELTALDENGNEFKYTPLEMVDAINGLNTETGKKLPWIVQRTNVPNFTITAEDIAGINSVGDNAFSDMKTLTAVELPDTAQSLGVRCFSGAIAIKEITLPASITTIALGAFQGCSNLETVRILNDTSVIIAPTGNYNDPFGSCPKLTSIYIPSKLYNDYCADAYWSQHKNKFITVGEWAFDPKRNPVLLFNQSVEISIQLQSFAITPEFSITSSNEAVATITNASLNEDNTLLTYTVNSLAVEGSSTITVNIVGTENTFNFVSTVTVYETIPEPTYEVVAVEGAKYGFALREDGYWESQNFKQSSSAAVCQVNISNLVGLPVYFDCINYAEANYDYGLLGAVNQVLGITNTDDTGVKKSFKGLSKPDIQTVEYTDATGECFIQVKFRKDSSGDNSNDSIRFKVRFGE